MVPIFIDSTEKQIEKQFNSLNGAIFPGGHRLLHHTNYTRVGKQIFDLALKAFDNGDFFSYLGGMSRFRAGCYAGQQVGFESWTTSHKSLY